MAGEAFATGARQGRHCDISTPIQKVSSSCLCAHAVRVLCVCARVCMRVVAQHKATKVGC
jgi:hypothetical protein